LSWASGRRKPGEFGQLVAEQRDQLSSAAGVYGPRRVAANVGAFGSIVSVWAEQRHG